MAMFRSEIARILDAARPDDRAELRDSVHAVLAAGARALDDLAALWLDRDGDGAVRDAARSVLAHVGGEHALAAFTAALKDPDVSRRHDATSALALLMLPGATPALLDVMQHDPDEDLQVHAALAIGSCGTSSAAALEALLALLADPNARPPRRGAAAEALNGFADARVSPALIAALDDPEPEVRYYAAFALGARTEVAALPALERLAATDRAVLPGLGSVGDEARAAYDLIRYNTTG